jgi:hypothetical protein
MQLSMKIISSGVCFLLLAAGLNFEARAQSAVSPLSVANETPNSYNCDVYRWIDSAGKQRTAALARNNAADPGGSHGGVLYQYRFTPAGAATERVISATGANGWNGYGFVVNHNSNDGAYVSTGTTGTYTNVFTGRHHAIHQFKLTYSINSVNTTATIHWYFATGQDNPVYAITFDTSAAGAGGITGFTVDSRAPYGDLQFGGDGSNPNVSGVAWGDKYKFFTRDEPVTPQSRWDYTQTNTVPYTQMWITSPDAEMGAVQTLSWLQHNTGGTWFTPNWGHTSENRVDSGSDFGAWMMPANWQWPYQLNQYEMMDNTSPTASKRCAWGLMYGAVGSTSYDGYGYEAKFSGHPYQSYSVATVIGLHSASAVQAQVTRTERMLAAALTANTGTLVTAGPGGAGRTDSVTYAKTGYNATYGAYELTAAAGAFSTTLTAAGAIKNPTFIIHGMGGVPSQLSLDGTTLVADQGYYASYDSASQTVWLTVATNWNGSHILASGAGVPPAVTVSVAPATVTLGRGVNTNFTATVTFATNTAVTWAVVEAGGGSVTAAGVYTAPTALGTYHVRATCVADATKSAEAAISVVVPTVAIAPATIALAPSGNTTFIATVTRATNTAVTWAVVETGGGSISTSGLYTAPATLGTYHVRATCIADPTISTTATVTVANLTPTYTYIYQSGLQGGWGNAGWGSTVNFAASTLGHTGTATAEVTIPNAWEGLAIGDISNWQNNTYHYLSDVTTIEFDIYPHSGSTSFENMQFELDDNASGTCDQPTIVSLIPNWATMTDAQRYNNWHHVTVNLASLHAQFDRFLTVVFFKMSDTGTPHFRLADIRMGSVPDVTAPVITLGTPTVAYDQLTLPFTTDESATYRVEYGYGDYAQTFTGPATGATSHSAVLTGLTRGATLQYRIIAADHAGNAAVLTGSAVITDPPPPTNATVTITANPAATRAISPWIYGANFYQDYSGVTRNLCLNRQGGNRWTAYNWENNASNAGNDWYHHNDEYLSSSSTPGEALRPLIVDDRAANRASLITVQMQGYVAADKNGDDVTTVTPMATRLATRFKQVVYKKPVATAGAFTTTPATNDANVYMDEFVWAMNQLVPGGIYTDTNKPTMLLLDNEPELWGSTHDEIQTGLITPADYITKTIALSRAIKDVAPTVTIFGPVHYGFNGIYNWQSSAGFSDTNWFTDKYLADMKAASDAYGKRLVDVYNFNWYSEATAGGNRVIGFTGTTLTDDQIQAIVQCPRSLWDATYTENSWITQVTQNPIRLLPRLQAKIDAIWPGTKLGITEWNCGGNNHIAGAIAIADNLGIFGQYGVFEASLWPLGTVTSSTFDGAAFKMYRDFDGALGSFGDISIPTASSDTAKVATYISRDSATPGRYVIVAINRSNAAQAVGFNGLDIAGTAKLYRLSGASTTPAAVGTATVNLTNWIVALPAYTITTIEITAAQANYAAWRAAGFGTNAANDAISGPAADPDHVGMPNFLRYAFNLNARGPVGSATTMGTTGTGAQRYLTLAFDRRAAGTDLSYIVEGSTNLVNWSTVTTYTPGSPTRVTAQDNVSFGSATRHFLRVRVLPVP